MMNLDANLAVTPTLFHEMDPNKIKFLYLTDPANPKRTVCFARYLEDGVIIWTWAMNNPVDLFSKEKARIKTLGRLQSPNYLFACSYNENSGKGVIRTMLEHATGTTYEIPSSLRRIVRSHLNNF